MRLKEAREQSGFANAYQAANALKIHHNTILRAESGKHRPTVSILRTLALGYGLPANHFIEEASDVDRASSRIVIEIDLPVGISPEVRSIIATSARSLGESLRNLINLLHEQKPNS